MLLRLELVTKYESSKVGAIPLVVVLSWEEYTGIVPTSFNRSVSKDRKRSVFRLGQGRGPTVQPGIFLFSFVLPFPFIWKEEEIDPQQLVIIPGRLPSLSQAWLAKYDSHWPPAQPRSTRIHLHSPFSLAVQARWPRSSSSLIENLYGFLRLYYFLFQ